MQFLNLLIFFYHMGCIRINVKKTVLSKETCIMLDSVLSRFMNFCVNYLIFMISTFLMMVLGFVDVTGHWSATADKVMLCAFYMYGSARFFTFLRAVYIFRPYWIVALGKLHAGIFDAKGSFVASSYAASQNNGTIINQSHVNSSVAAPPSPPLGSDSAVVVMQASSDPVYPPPSKGGDDDQKCD